MELESNSPVKKVRFKRKYQPVKYNPIRQIEYSDSKRTFLKNESCQSNTIGKDNDKILGMFCYDTKYSYY